MKRFFIMVAALLIFSAYGYAQGLRLGLSTSITSDIVLDNGIKTDPRYEAKYTYEFAPIGVNVSYDLTPGFGLSLEAIMANQEMIYNVIDVLDQVKGQQKLDMRLIKLPVLLRFMSNGNAATRFNMNLGPQFTFVSRAAETLAVQPGEFRIPGGITFEDIQSEYPTATQNSEQAASGTYEIPDDYYRDVLTRESNDFRDMDFQLAVALGLDIDLSDHFILTTQLRAIQKTVTNWPSCFVFCP
ncbi:MAG: outer membrane beta-barrel protein [Cyclobacteriaceae bacterium]